ncbi:MAG: hypothetical protein J6U10_07945 [Lachnospiraceae bacterium]|nr:hypothetical protein [Lachnospiraceae bacterium]
MTTEERVRSLHKRMDAMKHTLERRKTGFIGVIGVGLFIALVYVFSAVGGIHPGGTASLYSGSTILFDDVGGYVLVAVIAFVSAVIITILCIRMKEKQERTASESEKCSDNHFEEEEKV